MEWSGFTSSPKMYPQAEIRIMYVIPSLNVGGREKVLIDLVRHLDRAKFLPIVCCLREKGVLAETLLSQGIDVIAMGKKDRIEPCLGVRLALVLRKYRPQILHTHNPGALIYGYIAAKLARVPIVINTEHGYNSSISTSKMLVETLIRNRINKTIVVSKSLCNELSTRNWAVKERYVNLYNGIDISKFNGVVNKQETRRRLGFSGRDKVICIIARLEKVKDHATLLSAFKIVSEQVKHTRLLIVGDGPLHPRLLSYSKQLGVNPRVFFLGERRDIPEILSALDIFVLSSTFEGISITILEAMAASKPVVATAVGGNPEIIETETTGLLVPPRNPRLLASALTRLLQNEEEALLMGKAGRNRIEKWFRIEEVARKTESLYVSCIHSTQQ